MFIVCPILDAAIEPTQERNWDECIFKQVLLHFAENKSRASQ